MVFRERRPSRHRADEGKASQASAASPDQELESLLASIASPPPDSAAERTTRFDLATAFTLRLPELRIEQLRRLAEVRGMSPAELAARWLVERLDVEDAGSLGPVAPAPRREADVLPSLDEPSTDPTYPPGDQPATAALVDRPDDELMAPLSPVDQLNPVGELTPVSPVAPPAPVTPLFRHPAGAHASSAKRDKSKGPRHRAPEPVTSLHTRRKF